MLNSFTTLSGWNASLALLLIKATIILVAAIGITFTMRRASATARHLVWLVTLGTLLLVPVLTAWAPISLAVLPAKRVNSAGTGRSAAPQGDNVVNPNIVALSEAKGPYVAPSGTGPSAPPQGDKIMDTISAMSPLTLFAIVWSVVVAGILLSLAWAGLAVRRIVRNARALTSDDWMTPLLEISDRLELEEPPRLLQSSESKMPFACGMFTATIVLPEEAEGWSLERRRAVLLHELAHVRRHDLMGHTLGRLACAVYWFHPLVWKAAKQLRNESERACDDLALSCGTRATDYAEHLLDIVTTVRGDSTPLVALAMARRKEFEGRMLAILDPDLRRTGPTRKQSAVLIAALALISLTVGATSPVARAASAATVATAPAPAEKAVYSPAEKAQEHTVPVLPGKKAYPDSGVRGVVVNHLAVNQVTSNAVSTSVSTSTSTSTSPSTNPVISDKTLERLSNDAANFGVNVAANVLEIIGKGPKGEKGEKGSKDERADLLAKLLKSDTSAQVRRIAAWGLQEYTNNNNALDALVIAVRKDSDARVREMSAWALGEGGDRAGNAVDALSAALRSDKDEKVRITAAWALGQIGEHGSADGLIAALGDESPSVRLRAAWALGEMNIRSAPKPLVALLQDKEPRVRELAAWALHNIQDPSTAPAIQSAMKVEKNTQVQLAMLRALASLGERSVDAIKELLDSSDPQVKQMAVRALAGGKASGPWPWPWPEPRPYP